MSEPKRAMRDVSGPTAFALYLCFFLSGVAGLVYEVLWAKYLALYVGSTGLAQVIVLATFMGGLALGSQLLGGVADRVQNPLRFYAMIELGIGAYALVFDRVFELGRAVFLALVKMSGLTPGGLTVGKILACVLSILLPTFLMGGTLPAMGRYMTRTVKLVGPRISRLYFLNSLGAVFGCLLAGFYLISRFGLQFSMVTGAVMNVVVGIVALGIVTRERKAGEAATAEAVAETPSAEEALPRWAVVVVLISVAVSGGVSMMYEVAWIRLLTLVLGSSTYSFSLMLATFIFGLSIGAYLLSLRKKTSGYSLIFGLCETAVGLTVLLSLPFYVKLPYWFNQLASSLNREAATFSLYQFCTFLMCATVMFIPTILQGITLPAAIKVLVPDVRRLGHRIGYTYAVNTLGTLIGSVGAGFLGLPLLGIKGTLELAVALNCALGIAILFTERRPRPRWVSVAAGVAAVALIWGWYAYAMGPWDRQVLSAGIYRTRERIPSYAALKKEVAKRTTLFYRDGIDATIAVQHTVDPLPELMLVINGKVDASTGGDMPTQKVMAHLPMMMHAKPEKVLIVGVGSGATIGSVIAYPGVKKVDVVEISRDVIDASRLFEQINGRYWNDPRVNVYWEDAKTFLQVTDEKYDVIISEPTNPWIAGVAGVFSREYFETCRQHLADGGFFVQWIQGYELEDTTFFLILETFSGVFPCYTLWNPTQSDTVLVGSPEPYRPSLDQMEERLALDAVQMDLRTFGLTKLLPILGFQMADHAAKPSFVPWLDQVHSDFFPILDYVAPRGFFIGTQAGGVKWLDRRTQSPANAGLWIQDYMKGKAFPRDVYRECFTYAFLHPSLFTESARAWVREWLRAYPEDVEAVAALLQASEPDHQDYVARKVPPGPAGQVWNQVARRTQCKLAFEDYRKSRNFLDDAAAVELLERCRAWRADYELDIDPDLVRWVGELEADVGDRAAAIKTLTSAAMGLLGNPTRTDDLIETALRICELQLTAGDVAAAQEAFDAFLAGHIDQLRVWLMRSRIQTAAQAG